MTQQQNPMPPAPPLPGPPRRRRAATLPIQWLAPFLLVVLALVAVNLLTVATTRTWKRQNEAIVQLNADIQAKIGDERWMREDLEPYLLSRGLVVEQPPKDPQQSVQLVIYRHEASGARIMILYNNLRGASPASLAADWNKLTDALLLATGLVRIVGVGVLPAAWMFLLIAALVAERRNAARRAIAWLLPLGLGALLLQLTAPEMIESPGPWAIAWAAGAAVLAGAGLWLRQADLIGPRQGDLGDEPLCEVCEYNLRGNSSGVCPECGTPVPEWMRNPGTPAADPAAAPETPAPPAQAKP